MHHWRSYTKAEASALEDHYISGYKAEGLWGLGKAPTNDNLNKQPYSMTPAGIARVRKAKESKEEAYRLICQGPKTSRQVADIMRRSQSPVRRYIRALHEEGRIKVQSIMPGGTTLWVKA